MRKRRNVKMPAKTKPTAADLGQGRIVKAPLVKGRIVGLLVLQRRGFLSATQWSAAKNETMVPNLCSMECVVGTNAIRRRTRPDYF